MTSADRKRADALLARAALNGGPWVALLVLAALALAAAEIAFPAVLGRAVDAIGGGASSRGWLTAAGLLVAAVVLLDALEEAAAGITTAHSTAWLRKRLLDRVLAAGPADIGGGGPGDLVGRLLGNCTQGGRIAQMAVRTVVGLIPAVAAPVALALIDPWLCATFLLGVPVLFMLLRALTRDAQYVAERYLNAQGEIAGRLVDALHGVRSIAAAGALERETARVLEPLPELHRHGMGIWRIQMRIIAQDGLLVALLEVAVLSVAGLELSRGRITAGQLLSAGQYTLLGATMSSVLSSVTAGARARAAAQRIAEVLATPAFPYGQAALPAGGRGRLELRDVTVHGRGGPTLKRVSLDVAPGTLVAVVGRSGAGKSVLAQVAGRLRDPDEGDVLLDGVSLRELDKDELRRAVTYAFERPALIGATFGDAIAFGVDRPPTAERLGAARAARADEFISRLPRRYRTRVADAPLSGGEVQRVGIARAFAHHARLMILGDVAGSLDTVTERRIGDVLSGPLAGTTRLIVAQRASTAARADLVVWLEDGSIRACGPHAQLARDPGYRALFAPAEQPLRAVAVNGGGR